MHKEGIMMRVTAAGVYLYNTGSVALFLYVPGSYVLSAGERGSVALFLYVPGPYIVSAG